MRRLFAPWVLALNLILPATEASSQTEDETRLKIIELVNRAAKTNNQNLLAEYVKQGGPLNVQDQKGYTPLIFAAYYGHEQLITFLLGHGADPCLKDTRGNTALMGAIFKGNLKIAYQLMKTPCVIEQRNHADQTPLMFATLFGRKDIAKALIKQGAAVDAQDNQGRTARSLAVDQNNSEMLELLESLSITN
ncbi:ankyrin repeat domain-containing protein [Pseudobacteriovorax antillogorgiicola]|uniref:Uncharacterized protein n=1 Tax=Pseudobacteriovorax antillogorgiicola TaxID=1513793 RepID=A0A1Y6CIS9_9BACT|nr:ankyrin repeat domain-containing protein [Pseudobacteriovorax antillogorgiicola]TCS48275.1 hypothetical protein EDD56_11855 [Pseudobacteriovorax antillogorgiicola]SMF57063.1 hypothetical protein SAMN06296036_11886 [Pseudobacteriovorax antillogorgiicola]